MYEKQKEKTNNFLQKSENLYKSYDNLAGGVIPYITFFLPQVGERIFGTSLSIGIYKEGGLQVF